MDGLEFLRQVKEKQPNAFEILITAYANCEILKEAEMMGVKDFILKLTVTFNPGRMSGSRWCPRKNITLRKHTICGMAGL